MMKFLFKNNLITLQDGVDTSSRGDEEKDM